MARAERRERGLFKNGNRWWLRVRSPGGVVRKCSTGTDNLKEANKVAQMVEALRENRPQWEWLELLAAGEIELATVYNHYVTGTLHQLREQRAHAERRAADVDVEPWVEKWEKEHLAMQVKNGALRQETADAYVRQVRALIPAGEPFPRSQFTEETLKAKLDALLDARSGLPLSGSTRRRYVVAWQLFTKYARRRVPLEHNPFEFLDEWMPQNNSPRSTFYEFDKVRAVLDRMEGEARVAMTLVFGSGIELGALLRMTGASVGSNDERTIVAPGSKNEYREDRTIFVDRWAWPTVKEHARHVLPMAPLFTITEGELRQAFYEAQVAAGLIAQPEKSASYKWLWHAVKPHTIHDARHSYCINRTLGLDGEPRQDAKFCAHQLGHADEQMVLRIYAKANVRERLRLIELREAREAGQREGAAQAAGEQ